jgi:hypothetical protein
MRAMVMLLGLALAGPAGAQMHKCKDTAGKITYTSRECAQLGLQEAGEVRDSLNTVPLPAPSNRGTQPFRPLPQEVSPSTDAAQPAPAGESNDDRRCFKTAKGYRCNEKPEESEK